MNMMLLPGDQAPWFHAQALEGNPRYSFDTAAGRPILLLLMGSGAHPVTSAALAALARYRAAFDDTRASFFGVSTDPQDVTQRRIRQELPGIRWFLDHDRVVSTLYGAIDARDGQVRYRPHWLVLDTTMRVAARFPIEAGDDAFAALIALAETPEVYPAAPVLIVPRVLEPSLCRELIAAYQAGGGEDSGFMREEDGITVMRTDHSHKKRADFHLPDDDLRAGVRARLRRFLIPQIQRAFQFEVTRIERWLVACYDGDPADGGAGGHFRAHRDNTTKGTAHRKFACTINLNADDYDGGDLCFPEFGARTYRAPTGGAVIFSCSLLHEARPVTRGKRYAFLPFLYDEAGAALREANMAFVTPEIAGYRSGIEAVAG